MSRFIPVGNGKTPKNSKESLVEGEKEQLLNPWRHRWWSSWWLRQGRNPLHRRSLCQWLFWVEKFQKPQAWCYCSSTQTLLTDMWRDSPTSPWAIWLLYRGNYDLYTTWWYNCFFHLFFPFLSRSQNALEQCLCGRIISATTLFKGDVNLTTEKDILEKAMSFIHE